jgi:Outer membrane cobalamin receptor protein
MKFAATISLLLCLCQIQLFAQNKVQLSGKVTDSSGWPIAFATVGVENSSKGTYTNDNGQYTLNLEKGKYKIVVSSIGYKSFHEEITLNGSKKQDFVLEESSVNLEGVNIYGKSKIQQLREGSLAVNVLQIGDGLQNTSVNLNNIIGRTASVRVREEGGTGSDFNLSINGLSGNSVRYFIDGIPLSSLGSGVTLANIPTNIIDHVEIYKGVVPAHLGSDALGGAINIITKQNQRNYLDVSYGTGSFHTHKADLNAQLKKRETGLIIRPTVSMNYSKNDYMMKGVPLWDEESRKFLPVNRKRFHDDYFSFFGQLEVGFANKPWADAFFVSGSYSEIDKEIQTGSVQSKVIGMAERQSEAWGVSARYRKRDLFIKGLHLNVSLSHTWDNSLTTDTAYRQYDWNGDYIVSSNRNELYGKKRSLRHYKRPVTTARANLDYRLNDNHRFNLNYMLDRTGNDRYDELDIDFEPSNDILAKHIFGLTYSQSLLKGKMENSFFIKEYINHANIRQTDSPSLTGSDNVRGSNTQNFFGYGIGTRYTIVESLSIKASFEHSTRLPLSREMLGNAGTVLANVALKPEKSDNINLGIFGTRHPAPGHTVYYEANGFLRYVDDYIRNKPAEKDGTSTYRNEPAIHIKGVEGEVSYDWQNKLLLSANFSYQDARSQAKYKNDGTPLATYKNRVPNQPWLFGNVEACYVLHNMVRPGNRVRLSCVYRWVHWYHLDWENYGVDGDSKAVIPVQHIVDADITYSWNHGRYNIALECANVFNRMAYDNYKLQKPGRSFFAKFRLFIN